MTTKEALMKLKTEFDSKRTELEKEMKDVQDEMNYRKAFGHIKNEKLEDYSSVGELLWLYHKLVSDKQCWQSAYFKVLMILEEARLEAIHEWDQL